MATSAAYFCAFSAETARPPVGLESPSAVETHRQHSQKLPSDEQAKLDHQALEQCKVMVDKSFNGMKASTRRRVTLGKGVGFAHEHSPFCSYASRGGVHVMFAGEVSQWPGGVDSVSVAHDAFVRNDPPLEVDDAHWLLDFYDTFANTAAEAYTDDDELLERALMCLAGIRGTFAFVIYDEMSHRVLAARDAESGQSMYWGVTDDGQLLFGSALADLEPCNPTATMFPAGTLFASTKHTIAYNPGPRGWVIEGEDYPGELLSFMHYDADHWKAVKAIPRITSKGALCGHVFKVSSQADMKHPIMHNV